jgi:glyoxylase-like metal-dependent hydrolase (beta-lactamase superfamily II)
LTARPRGAEASPDTFPMSKAFASQADLADKKVTFTRLSDNAYAYTAEGDPNTGVVVGDDAVMVIDTQATPVMAQDVIHHIRTVTDKPVKYVVMSHYHAVRVLGASAYAKEGASEIIASEDTRDLIVERGAADMKSEIERFPRLFRAVETIPGLTWPTLTFKGEMTVWLGKLEVKLMQLGRGHTKGDTVAWLPQQKILFSGDLVEYGATAYAGDAYFNDWPQTLDKVEALGATAIVPGRGAALTDPAMCREGIATTRAFIRDLFASVKAGVAQGHDLKRVFADTDAKLRPAYGSQFIYEHCMPFDVSRAFDEATEHRDPRIWTAERDQQMWSALA